MSSSKGFHNDWKEGRRSWRGPKCTSKAMIHSVSASQSVVAKLPQALPGHSRHWGSTAFNFKGGGEVNRAPENWGGGGSRKGAQLTGTVIDIIGRQIEIFVNGCQPQQCP